MSVFETRFWRNVTKSDGCWLWTAGASDDGYGSAWDGARVMRAHRLSWIYLIGPIPDGKQVLHECDTRRCVRPDHLFLGDNTINQADKVAKGRQAKGIRNASAKLTPQKVIEAGRLFRGGMSKRGIARVMGVCDRTIRHALNGDTWVA